MRRRQGLVVAAAALGALGAGAAAAWWRSRSDDPELWRHRFTTLNGATLQLDRFRGRPLLVNFWATWCAPCVTELPLLDAFARAESSRWQVVALAIDNVDAVRRFATSRNLLLKIAIADDVGLQLARSLGNVQGGLPFTAVFESGGKLRASHVGAVDQTLLELWRNELL